MFSDNFFFVVLENEKVGKEKMRFHRAKEREKSEWLNSQNNDFYKHDNRKSANAVQSDQYRFESCRGEIKRLNGGRKEEKKDWAEVKDCY